MLIPKPDVYYNVLRFYTVFFTRYNRENVLQYIQETYILINFQFLNKNKT